MARARALRYCIWINYTTNTTVVATCTDKGGSTVIHPSSSIPYRLRHHQPASFHHTPRPPPPSPGHLVDRLLSSSPSTWITPVIRHHHRPPTVPFHSPATRPGVRRRRRLLAAAAAVSYRPSFIAARSVDRLDRRVVADTIVILHRSPIAVFVCHLTAVHIYLADKHLSSNIYLFIAPLFHLLPSSPHHPGVARRRPPIIIIPPCRTAPPSSPSPIPGIHSIAHRSSSSLSTIIVVRHRRPSFTQSPCRNHHHRHRHHRHHLPIP